MGSLGNKIKKEFLRNPAKTAVLAAISVVAIWFWAPLVWAYLPGREADVGRPATTAVAVEAVSSGQPAVIAGSKKEDQAFAFAWRTTVTQAEQDTQTKPHPPSEIARNPFAVAAAHAAVREVVEEETIEETPDLQFDSLGLTLTGTVVGKTFKAAKINGETYRLGDFISPLGFGLTNTVGGPPKVQLLLTEIQENFVRLEHRGTFYKLELKRGGKRVGKKIIMRGARVVAR